MRTEKKHSSAFASIQTIQDSPVSSHDFWVLSISKAHSKIVMSLQGCTPNFTV